ncbi:hypothetical protein ABPG74_004061 [Tetrahymena malaccensis]
MKDLSYPLTFNNSLDKQNGNQTVKDDAKLSMSVLQIKQIQQNEIKVSNIEAPQAVFKYCFGLSLLFQIIGTLIVLINFILQILEYSYDRYTLGLQIGFLVFSILSFITYIYLCSEASQWEPLNVFNSIRVSFIFTLIAFGIGVAILNIFTSKSWNCQQQISKAECYEQRITLIMRYCILICSGIPLILMAISIYKYKQYKQIPAQENEIDQKELHNVSAQQVIENDSNFFSNTSKLVYNTDLETSKYAYSSKAMANPQNMNILNEGLHSKNRIQMKRQVYELNNDQL